jgi:hypothetical protein
MIRDTANKLIEKFYGVLPYETAVHLANAQKELLHAVGSMIDEQIKWTDVHVARAHGREERQRIQPRGGSALEERLHP